MSETRKKLFELYSVLRGALSHNHDEDSQILSRGSGAEAFFVSEVAATTLQWWRTSILHAFDVSEYLDLKRHIQLAEDNYPPSTECDVRNFNDVTTPICQYSLFGTCSDKSCIYRHPTLLGGLLPFKPPNLRRIIHCNWLLRENWQQTAIKNSTNQLYKKRFCTISTVSAEQDTIHDEDGSYSMAAISTSMMGVADNDYKNQSNKICRSDAVRDPYNSYVAHTYHRRAWIAPFIKQSKELIAVQQKALNTDAGKSVSSSFGPTSTSSSFLSGDLGTSNLREFCIKILYGISSDLKIQREVCFKSCLQVLQYYLDASDSPDSLMWEMFLILVVECGMVDATSTFLVWPRIVQHVMSTLPPSRAITSLVGTVWCRVIPDHTPSLQQACPEQPTGDCHLAIPSALTFLHRMCDSGRPEVALDALCSRLDLPPLFRSTDQTCSVTLNLDSLPLHLSYAIFFSLFFTGKCVGRKLYYSPDSMYYMDTESNKISSESVRNMFRRCPFLEEIARDAFSACFNAIDRFQFLDSLGEDSSSESSFLMEDSLSAAEQCILWSYHVFIISLTVDNDAEHKQINDILKLCDPLCYPGVYEGTDIQQHALTPHDAADEVTPSRYLKVYSSLNKHLRTHRSSSAVLIAASRLKNSDTSSPEENEHINHGSATRLLTAVEVFRFVSDFWSEISANCSTWSRHTVISRVIQWVAELGRESFVCDDVIVKHFAEAFVTMCTNQLERMRTRGAQGTRVMKSAMFLNILSRQVLAVVKAACNTSANRITCVRVLEMVFVIVRISRRIDGCDPMISEMIPDGSTADVSEHQSTNGIKKRMRDDSSVKSVKDNTQHIPVEDDTCLDSCIAELDCTSPSMQHRLLEQTLDLLSGIDLIDFNMIEFILESSLFIMPCPDFVIDWVLNWFVLQDTPASRSNDCSHVTERERENGREKKGKKESCPHGALQPPSASLKSSILISNIFMNSLYLSSADFLSRLLPRTLFQVAYHSLRAENIDLFVKTKALLGDQSLYSAVLSTHIEDFVFSTIQEQYHVSSRKSESADSSHKRSNNEPVFPLIEDFNSLSAEGDEMIKRFLESLNAYRMKNKKSADFSFFVPQGLSYFPFQSLTLFAENLTDLNISNNFLKTFPESILFFFKLRKLNISKNEFPTLPDSLGKYLQELRTLDLGNNLLTSFPKCVLELKNLEELRLGDNLLEYIPAQIQGLTKLQHMDISGNKLKVFSTDLANIRFLKT